MGYMKVFDHKQMQFADYRTISSGIPSLVLMERAGKAIYDHITLRHEKKPVLVICGPGNNGGDGLITACMLKYSGWDVEVAIYGDKLSPDAQQIAQKWQGELLTLDEDIITNPRYEIIVDALFGIGINRDLEIESIVHKINSGRYHIISVDIPSGINTDTGEIMGCAIKANVTVTFSIGKIGHFIYPGREYTGELLVANIGIITSDIPSNVYVNNRHLWNLPGISYDHNKYNRGHTIICSGDSLCSGATKLCAMAAARSLCGAVTIELKKEHHYAYSGIFSAAMFHVYEGAEKFKEFIKDRYITSVIIGPASGVTEITKEKVLAALETKVACVIDADAISIFKDNPSELFEAINNNVILTPHEGEFSRIFPNITGSKVQRVYEAAKISGAVIVLKGADTVIGSPDGRVYINNNALPILATAGSGDVLSGIIGGFVAAGMNLLAAAGAGVWVHSECSNRFNSPGMIADDIQTFIPEVLSHLIEVSK